MNTKRGLTESLQRLLKRRGSGEEGIETDWLAWFARDEVHRGFLTLSRAGLESYRSHVLAARTTDEGRLNLIVDMLLPQPEESFWHEPVSLQGTLIAFDAGTEQTATFTASVGGRIEFEGAAAVELEGLFDLERTDREYIAALGQAHNVELGFIWFDDWVQVRPSHASVKRLFFDADLGQNIGVDGYAVPRATLRLGPKSPEVPVRVQLYHHNREGYEAVLEKIDGVALQQLTAIVEEIWRTAAGLSQRKMEAAQRDVGYVSKTHDSLQEAFEPHLFFLGEDAAWAGLLERSGKRVDLPEKDLGAVTEAVTSARCDLILGDADLWQEGAVQVERLLRTTSRLRDVPRLWIRDPQRLHEPIETTPETEEEPGRDLLDYGAFDVLPRNLSELEAIRRINWALGLDSLGEGPTALLVSQNNRLRYRLGLELVGRNRLRFATYNRLQGILPALEKHRPRWVLLDADSFEVDVDEMLSKVMNWSRTVRTDTYMLSRGAEKERVARWLREGARDIVILDPALRQAAARLRERIFGQHAT